MFEFHPLPRKGIKLKKGGTSMGLKARMLQERLYGCFIKISRDPAITLLAKEAQLDFLFYDAEHGMYTYETLHDLLLMGNAVGIPAIVRVPQLARGDVSRALDCGATGVMVPMIETKEQAELLVQWSKYPPVGKRSYSGGANTHYGPSGNHRRNMDQQNDEVITIVQIETALGVANVKEILSVDGIDAAIVGPADLCISLDIPGDYFHPKATGAIDQVVAACQQSGKAFGIIGKLGLIEKYKEKINFLIHRIDVELLREGFQNAVKEFDALYQR